MINIEEHKGLVHNFVQKYAKPGTQLYEDLVVAGMEGLHRAAQKFNPERGAQFSTYATYWLKAIVLKVLDKHIKDPAKVSLDGIEIEPADTSADVFEMVANKLDVETILSNIKREKDRNILCMRYGLEPHTKPHTLEEIGARYKVTRQRISQLEQMLLNELRRKSNVTKEIKEVIKMEGMFIPLEKLKEGGVVIQPHNSGRFQKIREAVLKILKPRMALRVTDLIKQIPELSSLKGPRRYNYLHNAMKPLPNVEFVNVNGDSFIGMHPAKESE